MYSLLGNIYIKGRGLSFQWNRLDSTEKEEKNPVYLPQLCSPGEQGSLVAGLGSNGPHVERALLAPNNMQAVSDMVMCLKMCLKHMDNITAVNSGGVNHIPDAISGYVTPTCKTTSSKHLGCKATTPQEIDPMGCMSQVDVMGVA